jgi:putative tricarboxylic transport membrane protein
VKAVAKAELVRDFAAGTVGLVLAGGYWLGADEIPRSSLIGKGIGADALPKALAVAMALFCAILIAQSVWRWRQAVGDVRPADAAVRRGKHLRAAGMLLIGLAYFLLLEEIGYPLSIFLLSAAASVYSGIRSPWKVVAFAAGITVGFYLLFVRLLGIHMPSGIWPDLWRWIAG